MGKMMEELPLVDLLATGPSRPIAETDSCEDCSKKFRPLYRKRHHCSGCGKDVCTRCLDSQKLCIQCSVQCQLAPLIQWAAQDSTVPFDGAVAVNTLAGMGSCTELRAILTRGGRHGRTASEEDPEDAPYVLEDVPDTAIEAWGPSLLKLDPALAQLRFELVPQRVSEEVFWVRYFQEAARRLQHEFAVDEGSLMTELERGLQRAYRDGPESGVKLGAGCGTLHRGEDIVVVVHDDDVLMGA